MELNFNSLTVDANGRVSFSGLSSGIDFRAVVESIIAARRIPIDSLETRVVENQDQITALEDLRTNLDGLKQALSKLRGAVSFGNVNDIFEAKQAFASTSRLDGTVASAAGNLIGVTVTNAAAAGTHTIEVLQSASAHKVSSDKTTSLSTTLAALTAGDTFTINGGKSFQSAQQVGASTQIGSSGTLDFTRISDSTSLGSVTYTSTDTLQDLATNITNNVSGATATVVSSGTGVRLEITATDAMTIAETGAGTALTDLQITDKNQITVTGTETLADFRDRINNAETGVTASIASVSGTEHYRLLTKDVTGEAMVITDDTGDALESLGILTAAGAFNNELKTAQSSRFYIDGLLDQTNKIYESSFQTAATVQAGSAGTIQFTRDSDSFNLGSITYGATDTLTAIAANITANITDVTATVVTDGAGSRLEITGTNGFSMAETGAGTALTDLGIDNKRLALVRNTNTVDDVFSGITLSLFQAEKGTTIKVEIERDLSSVKTEIANFVDAYNTLKIFVNEQRRFDKSDGDESDDSGALFNSRALIDVDSALSLIVSNGVPGVDINYSVLAQIGIDFVDNNALSDPLLNNTIEIDETRLDAVLLNNSDDVKRLFGFDFTPSDSRITLLAYGNNTSYNAAGYTLNLQPTVGGSNLLQYSEQADNAYWTKIRATVSANGAVGPDGATTADGLIADATNNTHLLLNATPETVTAGTTYTYSTYVKAGNQPQARISLAGSFATSANADFDLTTGTVVTTGIGADSAAIENVGNGWYRVSVTATATATGNGFAERYSKSASSTVFTGDGTTVNTWFWGAQMEAETTATTNVNETGLTAVRTTIGANLTIAPDGTLTADQISSDAVNDTHSVTTTTAVAVTSGQSYTYSTYAKAGNEQNAMITLAGASFASLTRAEFDLDGGTVVNTGSGATSASIDDDGGGWYRISVVGTATSTGTATFDLNVVDSVSGTTFTGAGAPTVDMHFTDLKVQPTRSPGGYVPTTGAAVANSSASANIDGATEGANDGSATVANNIITVNTGGARGLRLLYGAINLSSAIQLDFTLGVGAQMFNKIEALLDTTTGVVETEIDTLTDTNELSESRIEEMLVRLDIQRRDLLERFIRMETSLATAQRILDSIRQTTEALFSRR